MHMQHFLVAELRNEEAEGGGAFWFPNRTYISFKGTTAHVKLFPPLEHMRSLMPGGPAKSLCSHCEVTTAKMCTIKP